MKPQDNPHFTAYALGELSAEEAHALHEALASTPAAVHELEQIEAVTDALRQGAPIPQVRLTHEQRHALLHPANLPRRIQPMLPRKPAQRPRQAFWPVMGTLLKAAAAIAITGGAFLAGWSLSPVVKDAAQIVATPPKAKPSLEVAVKPQQAPEKAVPAPQVAAAPIKPQPQVKNETSAPVPPKLVVVTTPTPAPVVVSTVKAPAIVTTPPNLGFTMPAGRGVFASTTKQATDQFNLHPALIKPVPTKPQGQAFASPLPPNTKIEVKPTRASELYIHSWKAEVANCPWNAAHRLLRIVIQVPADQVAVLGSDTGFPLQVTFDAANVKQFRMLCERHLVAAELRSAGTHVLWYEFQPNGGEGTRDRQIASITHSNARFTSQTVGPFDSSKLQVIDRGYSLQNAREDFVFETSVVGFGLLLRGANEVGSLNHDLVLNLAKQGKGTDASGERAKFIRVVQDAQHVAGL